MVTVYRAIGLRVVIFTDDHEPAHVHVFGDGQAKINLHGANGDVELVWIDSMTKNEARRALRLVTEHRTLFQRRWREIHG